LEIFQYSKVVDNEIPTPNQKGYGHIAFQVENIKDILNLAIQNGAKTIGKISDHMDDGVGHLTFIYISDPDGNIIELQNWS
jgi:catechol 2,3-dioxygenase-like lactoylglutathione lyase family enzyme